ncbi:MAG: TIGR03435 family protein [Acidobacteriaceae bacterium]
MFTRSADAKHFSLGLTLLTAFIFVALPASTAVAQVATPSAPDFDRTCAAPAPADDPTHGIAFDAVSIRPIEPYGGHLTNPPDGDGITIKNYNLDDIIRWDFNLGFAWRDDQLQGTPKWYSTDEFVIQAKVADSDVAAWQKLDDAARRLVFRKVLVERFKLACHFVDVDRPVYNLVIAKGGPKMKEATPEDSKRFTGTFCLLPDYFGVRVCLLNNPGSAPGSDGLGFPDISMKTFADQYLTKSTGRTVLDKTGLTAAYTFILNDTSPEARLSASPDDSGSASETTASSLFTALPEQLGLKLEPARGPVPVLVIDHLEHPTQN